MNMQNIDTNNSSLFQSNTSILNSINGSIQPQPDLKANFFSIIN